MAASDEGLSEAFAEFCKVSGSKTGKMTNKAWTKMVKDTKIVDKKFTSTDTDIIWSRMAPKGAKEIDLPAFKKALKDIVAPEYGKKHGISDVEEAHNKLLEKIKSGKAQMHGVTKQSKTGGVDHFTDTSKYTGAHKERFDESGKGKGIEGRADVAENTGYVGGYKGKDTYDEKTKPK